MDNWNAVSDTWDTTASNFTRLNYSVAQCTSLKYLSYQFMEQTFKTNKSDHLPLELWYKIFHYIRVEDTLQLSLVTQNLIVYHYKWIFIILDKLITSGIRCYFWFLNQITDKFSWQVCKNFKELINKNALWRWYCLKKCTSLTLKQVNSFPSCKEFYREILKPFSFAVGHSFMFPG